MHTPSRLLKGMKGKNFEVDIEYSEDYIALHLPKVTKFNKETFLEMKDMLSELDCFFKTAGYRGTYVAFRPDNKKMKKLVSMLNFEYVMDNLGFSIYKYIGE